MSGGGWLSRLTAGLGRSAGRLGEQIGGVFTRRKLDQAALDELEDLLIAADLGPVVAGDVTARLRAEKFERDVTDEEVREALAAVVAETLAPVALPLDIDPRAARSEARRAGRTDRLTGICFGRIVVLRNRRGRPIINSCRGLFGTPALVIRHPRGCRSR